MSSAGRETGRAMVRVRELAGWGLDGSARREAAIGTEALRVRSRAAEARVASRPTVDAWDALAMEETTDWAERLRREMGREDLLAEMEGLEWEVGMVRLDRLVALQRRLLLEETLNLPGWQGGGLRDRVVEDGGVAALMRVAFGERRAAAYAMWVEDGGFGLQSESPNLRLRMTEQGDLRVDGGSPFLEVAEWRERWFLRDGYHRAYALLRAGVRCVPAVMVRARSIDEVRASGMGFFDEAVMLAERPPMVADFVEDGLCLQYEQPRLVKRMRVRVEEWMEEETEVAGVRGQSDGYVPCEVTNTSRNER